MFNSLQGIYTDDKTSVYSDQGFRWWEAIPSPHIWIAIQPLGNNLSNTSRLLKETSIVSCDFWCWSIGMVSLNGSLPHLMTSTPCERMYHRCTGAKLLGLLHTELTASRWMSLGCVWLTLRCSFFVVCPASSAPVGCYQWAGCRQ